MPKKILATAKIIPSPVLGFFLVCRHHARTLIAIPLISAIAEEGGYAICPINHTKKA